MTLAQMLAPEFDQEMATTRRMLERVPADKLAWTPHPKSMTAGQLAGHLAELPTWINATLQMTDLDLAGYESKKHTSLDTILADFDAAVAAAKPVLANAPDADFAVDWTLRMGDQVFFTMPRLAVLRSFVFSHIVHHRAQLGVYLRLLDVPVPGSYGPSADEGM